MAERKPPSAKRALDEALRSMTNEQQDQATLALAKRYAVYIDENPGELKQFGPLLLESLRELRMTPKSRSAVVKGDSGDDGGSAKRAAFDELTRRREDRTKTVDS